MEASFDSVLVPVRLKWNIFTCTCTRIRWLKLIETLHRVIIEPWKMYLSNIRPSPLSCPESIYIVLFKPFASAGVSNSISTRLVTTVLIDHKFFIAELFWHIKISFHSKNTKKSLGNHKRGKDLMKDCGKYKIDLMLTLVKWVNVQNITKRQTISIVDY